MRPVIKRIAKRVRHGGGPGLEFLKRRGVAGAKAFGHAVETHGAPFVVITFKPDFEKILEPAVFRDFPRREMTVIIQNRLVFGEPMVEPACRACLQQKIFMNEFHFLAG